MRYLFYGDFQFFFLLENPENRPKCFFFIFRSNIACNNSHNKKPNQTNNVWISFYMIKKNIEKVCETYSMCIRKRIHVHIYIYRLIQTKKDIENVKSKLTINGVSNFANRKILDLWNGTMVSIKMSDKSSKCHRPFFCRPTSFSALSFRRLQASYLYIYVCGWAYSYVLFGAIHTHYILSDIDICCADLNPEEKLSTCRPRAFLPVGCWQFHADTYKCIYTYFSIFIYVLVLRIIMYQKLTYICYVLETKTLAGIATSIRTK